MEKPFFYFLIILGCFCLENLQAQEIEPTHLAKAIEVTDQSKNTRPEDNFVKKRVRYRIDLEEKINKPMAHFTSQIYDENSRVTTSNRDRFDFRGGLVEALLIGYANGFMEGYLPDTLDRPFEFNEFRTLYSKSKDLNISKDPNEEEENDRTTDEDEEDQNKQIPINNVGCFGGVTFESENDFSDLVKAVDVIEDRIFDKNKSSMVYQPKYIIIYSRNTADIEVPMVAFRYEDVADTVLSKCQWTNRFNDAEHRNLKEIFELRLFSSYLNGLCSDPIPNLDISEQRRVQMLDFEHNLFEL